MKKRLLMNLKLIFHKDKFESLADTRIYSMFTSI